MNKMKFFLALSVLFLMGSTGYAQGDGTSVDMADTMRSNGRIYVVVAVVMLILLGLILYLVRLDRKMTRIERDKS